ncbi:hypothetical protein IMCC3317_44760 [Kordia antarctica]|uniref:DUF4129 domain-containing protein n=1 Tax=Kordia antarctica TaxID=1218801 RepID=A0A7L4ZQZ0_9FLAO|nr:DUF4129 domain-containing protein [Kordia antarctica]QHI39075.1 hypothetical protein IMCC3317_44760 [Kordia antarctica]
MSRKINHIFYNFLRIGIFFIISLSGSVSHATNAVQQQVPVIQDTSDVTPKTYDEDFKDRYESSEYIYEEEKTKGWFSRFIDWLEATIESLFDFESRQDAADFLISAKNIFYVVIIIIVVFLIVRAIMNGEGRWVFGKASDRKRITHEDVETNIHIIDFTTLISEALTNNEYRLAIRYQYLHMLKKMSASEIIKYDPEKTNLDYSHEIKNEKVREQFLYTSYLYNYVWYGEFTIDKEQYEQAEESFNLILKNMAA